MIHIEKIQPLTRNYIDDVLKEFNLIEDRRGKDTIYYKLIK